MIIDCVADLHGFYPELEGGDLLIVAGDLVRNGDSENEFALFDYWLNDQKYNKKIVIAGNHDKALFESRIKLQFCDYLCDCGTEFEHLEDQECNWCKTPREGSPWIKCSHTVMCPHKVTKKVKIWGSPWTQTFEGMNPKCKAFTFDTDEELAEKWALIPNDIDILVTHSPPWGMMDGPDPETRYGSTSLLRRKTEIGTRQIQLHVFGHIHEGYGIFDIRKIQKELGDPLVPVCVNASHVNEYYEPVNKPIKVIL